MAVTVDTARVEAIIREVAEAEILPLFRNLAKGDISTKSGPNDLVTVADVAAEDALTPRLTELVPGSVVIGEESASKDPSVFDAFKGDAPIWIIDPIDGTRNFVNGKAEFATMVALVVGGATRAAWIYPPIDGSCAVAEEGSGAFWHGARLASKTDTPLGSMTGTYHKNYMPKEWARIIEPNLKSLGKTGPAHCAAYVYLRLSSGEADFGLHGKLMPWDHCAGDLMLREAGGGNYFIDDEAPHEYAPGLFPERPLASLADAAAGERVKAALTVKKTGIF